MATSYQSAEPFPLFIDSSPAKAVNYLSGLKLNQYFTSSTRTSSQHPEKPSTSSTTKLNNAILKTYYQYEVTLGIYVMEPTEKIIANSIIFGLLLAFLCAFAWGVEPLVVRLICNTSHYLNTPAGRLGELCKNM